MGLWRFLGHGDWAFGHGPDSHLIKHFSIFPASIFKFEENKDQFLIYLDYLGKRYKNCNKKKGPFLVPLRLLGEGSYALSSVKQISVTEDYLKLSDDTRKCQNIESFEQCVTKHNLATISKTCKCIPYWLRNFTNDEVDTQLILQKNKEYLIFGSVRSSRSHNLHSFVRLVLICLEYSIFIFLAQISLRSISGLFQLTLKD